MATSKQKLQRQYWVALGTVIGFRGYMRMVLSLINRLPISQYCFQKRGEEFVQELKWMETRIRNEMQKL